MPGARAGRPTHVAATGTYKAGVVTVDGIVFANDNAAKQIADIHDATGATNLVMRVVVPLTGSFAVHGMRFDTGLHLVLGTDVTASVIES